MRCTNSKSSFMKIKEQQGLNEITRYNLYPSASISGAAAPGYSSGQALELMEQMAAVKLLIIDELGFVPLSKTGAELLFEMISQRYERGATLITSNLPFEEWTETFGTERLTGALLDRLTHHVNILEMNGESYRLAQSRARKAADIN